jgi:hypothetical protein
MLLKLGKLRSDFAHKLDAAISKQSALDLYNGLSNKHRAVLQDSYKAMVNKSVFSFAEIEPRDLVTLIFLNMHSATKAAAFASQRGAS